MLHAGMQLSFFIVSDMLHHSGTVSQPSSYNKTLTLLNTSDVTLGGDGDGMIAR